MKIAYIVFSDLKYDQRVKQEIDTLSRYYDVYSISLGSGSGKGYNVEIKTVKTHGLRFIMSWLKFFTAIYSVKPDLLFFADINTMPPALMYKMLFNIPVIFDMHEIGSEMRKKQNFFVKLFWKIIEFTALKQADDIVTVNNALSDYVKEHVNRKVSILYNYPSAEKWNIVSVNHPRDFCYVGNLVEDRGLELIVEAFREFNSYTLHIIGDGKLRKKLEYTAKGAKNIRFYGMIPMEKLPFEVAKYGVGIVFNEGKSKNNRLGLPNKIFQYLRLGMPVICSKLPEVEKLIKKTGTGVVCDFSVSEIGKGLKEISENYTEFRKNAERYREKFVWEKQEHTLMELVKSYE